MTMLDKCARAVQDVQGGLNYAYAEFCRDAARAVLKALRNPTPEMVEAFWATNAAAETVFADPGDLFRAMIDEALKERT